MKTQHYFDISQINRIQLVKENFTSHKWVEASPAKKAFFGLITTQDAHPAGFMDSYGDVYTEEHLKRYDYVIRPNPNTGKPEVYSKAYVMVFLKSEHDSICQTFESNEQAQEWVNDLIAKSAKIFNKINYE